MRLSAGPIASAIQPKPNMPTIAAAIDPVLNVVRHPAHQVLWRDFLEQGPHHGIEHGGSRPDQQHKCRRDIGDSRTLRAHRASPPTVVPLTRTCMRLCTSFFRLTASHEDAVSIPAPRADQSQPSSTGPTCNVSFAYTGRTKTNALAPKLKRAEIATSTKTMERSVKTKRKPTDRSLSTDPGAAALSRLRPTVSGLRIGIRHSAEIKKVAAFT